MRFIEGILGLGGLEREEEARYWQVVRATAGVSAASSFPSRVTPPPSLRRCEHPFVVLLLGDGRAVANHTGSVSALQVGGRCAFHMAQMKT